MHCHQNFGFHLAWVCFGWLSLAPWSPALLAQQESSTESSALVDGLLDLLNEPPPQPPPDSQPPRGTPAPRSEAPMESAGNGNPLQSVRQRMLTAASYLSQGVADAQTRKLQSEIVLELDALIRELEQSAPPQSGPPEPQLAPPQSAASPEQSTSPAAPSPAPAPAPQSTAESDQPDERPDSGAADPAPAPAQKGEAVRPNVNLADPKTLQQNVWGQLPEQVRKQMQSRMVEQFLPSYRQQIEAYFQALIAEPPAAP